MIHTLNSPKVYTKPCFAALSNGEVKELDLLASAAVAEQCRQGHNFMPQIFYLSEKEVLDVRTSCCYGDLP